MVFEDEKGSKYKGKANNAVKGEVCGVDIEPTHAGDGYIGINKWP
tara:strand:+ start:203 stop:337 length:135 start_codon:yes stop_codon:yes gene_type:complete